MYESLHHTSSPYGGIEENEQQLGSNEQNVAADTSETSNATTSENEQNRPVSRSHSNIAAVPHPPSSPSHMLSSSGSVSALQGSTTLHDVFAAETALTSSCHECHSQNEPRLQKGACLCSVMLLVALLHG